MGLVPSGHSHQEYEASSHLVSARTGEWASYCEEGGNPVERRAG